MRENYDDIKSKINESPKWYDANGTPRYAEFHPQLCPNIYADVVFLAKIACQNCGKQFDVEMHYDWFSAGRARVPKKAHYGDPPCHGCIGDTMNCDDLEVLQVWQRIDHEWTRLPDLEGPVDEQVW